MLTRIVRPEEQYLCYRVQATAYEQVYDREKGEQPHLGEPQELPKEEAGHVFIGAFSDDEKVVYSCLENKKYRCMFDGKEADIVGIGGVATLPQYRRNGAVRACIQKSLEQMYEEQATFSFLYPFSVEYYRQFGYETGLGAYEWTAPLKGLPTAQVKGHVEQLFPGDDMSPLLAVYKKFYDGYNLSMMRNVYSKELEEGNFMKDKRYVYVWYNEQEEPRSFLIMNKVSEHGERILNTITNFGMENDFLFLDTEALLAMFTFLRASFPSYYDKIRFAVPISISLTELVGENNNAVCKWQGGPMIRVVNVEQALRMCKCRGTGTLRLEIIDEMLSENNGVWKITFEEGKENKVERVREAADITMPIGSFSTLLCGAKDAADILWMPKVSVHGNQERLGQIFYRKKSYIADLF